MALLLVLLLSSRRGGYVAGEEDGEVPEERWQSLGDQVGQGVHRAPRVHRTASWHGHGLPRGAAGGEQGKRGGEKNPPRLRQRARNRAWAFCLRSAAACACPALLRVCCNNISPLRLG